MANHGDMTLTGKTSGLISAAYLAPRSHTLFLLRLAVCPASAYLSKVPTIFVRHDKPTGSPKTSEYGSVTNVPPDRCLELRAPPYALQTPGSGDLTRTHRLKRSAHQRISGAVRHSGEIVGARQQCTQTIKLAMQAAKMIPWTKLIEFTGMATRRKWKTQQDASPP